MWFGKQEVLSKGSDDLQPPSQIKPVGCSGKARPANRELAGQWTSVTEPIGVASEVLQLLPLAFKLETKGTTVDKISVHLGKHGCFHRLVLGQGRATRRSSSKLTCAYRCVDSNDRWPSTSAISFRPLPRR